LHLQFSTLYVKTLSKLIHILQAASLCPKR
jgi:hypothetical protein